MRALGVFFVICGGILGVMSAIDEYLETSAQTATPPEVYVSPAYIPPHSDILWCVAIILGGLCVKLGTKKPIDPV